MEIEKFIERKRQMEQSIAAAIAKEIALFKLDTGYEPSDIQIDMIDITMISQKKREYKIDRVITSVEF